MLTAPSLKKGAMGLHAAEDYGTMDALNEREHCAFGDDVLAP